MAYFFVRRGRGGIMGANTEDLDVSFSGRRLYIVGRYVTTFAGASVQITITA
ncbi:hypothetical protein [Trueperella pyogenes]|uniref:hypothetical protein n=1 Tax=Trueperella pyogenes TaxID=1661 RepID=UPI000A74C8C0